MVQSSLENLDGNKELQTEFTSYQVSYRRVMSDDPSCHVPSIH